MAKKIETKEGRTKPRPPVKWAGGKGQLLSQFQPFFPENFNLYGEPFLGGGAVFFHLLPEKGVLIDNNFELINFYRVVRDKLEDLLEDLGQHINDKEYFYKIRAIDPEELSDVERASRFIFLNKTAYNGLWRVNKKGKFNVPFGKYKNPKYKDTENLVAVSQSLKNHTLINGDFTEIISYMGRNDFVYFDPPYHPLSESSNFTSYTLDSFGKKDQERLANCFRELDQKGCQVMLSNSDTEFIRDLYRGYRMEKVFARRAINCKADGRGKISEIVIKNY